VKSENVLQLLEGHYTWLWYSYQ